jgi:phosphatidylethanolamine/phosphatidyl-N-methylethanolamine N-methyltransferase
LSGAADQLRFLARLIAQPQHTGAVAPSSPGLTKAMAAQVDPNAALPILEFGPGTGVVTEALIARGIAPARITAVEYDAEFAQRVRERCPGVTVIQGDAFDLDKTLGARARDTFAAAVSSLPLVNFPQAVRDAFIADIFKRLAPGAPFVQFSYRLKPPVAPPPGVTLQRAAVIWLNVPPARVWVYRRR